MPKAVAIVAAMRNEVAPLVQGVKPRSVEGVHLYEIASALIAVGGMGRAAAQHAAEVVVREANPELLVSAGFAGALTPGLKTGQVLHIREVVDQATGEHYTASNGDAVLVTATRVTAMNGKRRLAIFFAASAVDMEAAAVAEIARQHGIPFSAVKAISDELDFPMPPVNIFVDPQGRFRTAAFVAYVGLRPRWWIPVVRLARNGGRASKNLALALHHLIEQHGQYSRRGEKGLV